MAVNSKDNLNFRLIKAGLNMLARIPRKQLVGLARPLGRLWYAIDHYHRRIASDNLSSAFGRELSPAGIRSLARDNFVQLVRVMLEIPSLLNLSKENLDTYVEFSGLEHFEAALARGTGVLVLTAHLGNWELMAVATALKYEIPFHVMVRPLDYTPMDRVLTEIRSRTGNRVLDKDKSAAEVSTLLRENQVVGILLDQNSSWYEGVYVPFFGKTACTNKGLAMFAMRYGATVLPAFNIRQPDGRYRVIISPPVDLVRSGNVGDDIVENTSCFNKIIEDHIRLAPDNWLWVHRRWRIKKIPERVRRKIKGVLGDGPLD
ncbi:MAG: lysophospholipid acyltransferase family protein [Thermodesulfobacteriota bacterium]